MSDTLRVYVDGEEMETWTSHDAQAVWFNFTYKKPPRWQILRWRLLDWLTR